jgi:hypothetical protein
MASRSSVNGCVVALFLGVAVAISHVQHSDEQGERTREEVMTPRNGSCFPVILDRFSSFYTLPYLSKYRVGTALSTLVRETRPSTVLSSQRASSANQEVPLSIPSLVNGCVEERSFSPPMRTEYEMERGLRMGSGFGRTVLGVVWKHVFVLFSVLGHEKPGLRTDDQRPTTNRRRPAARRTTIVKRVRLLILSSYGSRRLACERCKL